ncbi:MAG: GAF domain-containing protein [candidate division Zixibacteria bacterium]|nr:GAF domain-containing protein [candidate division Zixibacteria bacterium]
MKKKETEIIKQIDELVQSKKEREEVLRETVKVLKENYEHYNWVGIYLLEGDELVLGPYLGKPSPHTRIRLNKGICGAAASQKKTVNIPDVSADPRYLACSLETRSEIVVPIMRGEQVFGEVDIDSNKLSAFSKEEQLLLEQVCSILSELF